MVVFYFLMQIIPTVPTKCRYLSKQSIYYIIGHFLVRSINITAISVEKVLEFRHETCHRFILAVAKGLNSAEEESSASANETNFLP